MRGSRSALPLLSACFENFSGFRSASFEHHLASSAEANPFRFCLQKYKNI